MGTPISGFSVCVFCGVADGPTPAYLAAAEELGKALAGRAHRLVYGAGGIGLMGAVARGAAAHEGEITGVIPRFLRSREIGDELPPQTVVFTDDLLERKRVMIERADAFIAMPGGYGTLDEVLEVVSMAALGLDVGPLVLVDVEGDWKSFTALLDDLYARGFVRRNDLCHVVSSPAEAVDLLERLLAAEVTPVGAR